jgi:hypothetical protein
MVLSRGRARDALAPRVCKPGRPSARLRILSNVRNDLKSYAGQQLGIFGGPEARMIERVAAVTSDRFAVRRAALNINTADGPACLAKMSNISR